MLTSLGAKSAEFSLNHGTLDAIFQHARPMGHHEDRSTGNLGFGFLYYGLIRALRPEHVVVVGSGYGFSVVCLALGLKDNGKGTLTFVDPAYTLLRNGPMRTIGGAAQWVDPDQVTSHFARFGVQRIVTHHRLTSEQFFGSYENRALPPIDVAFIDGNHSFSAVNHDFKAAVRQSRRNSYLFLHDTNLYIRELVRHAGVKRLTRAIGQRPEDFEIIDFPFASGVALVRVLHDGPWTKPTA